MFPASPLQQDDQAASDSSTSRPVLGVVCTAAVATAARGWADSSRTASPAAVSPPQPRVLASVLDRFRGGSTSPETGPAASLRLGAIFTTPCQNVLGSFPPTSSKPNAEYTSWSRLPFATTVAVVCALAVPESPWALALGFVLWRNGITPMELFIMSATDCMRW